MKFFAGFLSALFVLGGCVHYRDVKEIKTVGFSDDLSKGKSVGQFEADDCVFKVFGYYLGGSPDISRAISNARTQKKTKITDVAYDQKDEGKPLRYVNNMTVKYDGFNAYLFGKQCVVVSGVGYL